MGPVIGLVFVIFLVAICIYDIVHSHTKSGSCNGCSNGSCGASCSGCAGCGEQEIVVTVKRKKEK